MLRLGDGGSEGSTLTRHARLAQQRVNTPPSPPFACGNPIPQRAKIALNSNIATEVTLS
ncbi:MAG: hypothetical protein RIG63_23185 [Coleofasciculus chthonoplastes F3-SA18-01]|uniref:hypothetical protein n=1 Tax=Coleofasciculus chthonoplastes TaxID=64178 RepID=UPI00330358A1